jgi:hypothetical protein
MFCNFIAATPKEILCDQKDLQAFETRAPIRQEICPDIQFDKRRLDFQRPQPSCGR